MLQVTLLSYSMLTAMLTPDMTEDGPWEFESIESQDSQDGVSTYLHKFVFVDASSRLIGKLL